MEIISHQHTKIIATVGPACREKKHLLGLAQAGIDTFRLNFSHGEHADHQKVIHHISEINAEHNLHLGIIADLQGPKLRIGEIKNNKLTLKEGDMITLVQTDCLGTKECIYMNYGRFALDVEPGERILIDDGKLVFEVIETNNKDTVKLKTLYGGDLSSRKGVNLPDTKITLPSLTKKDLLDLDFILTQPVQWIALSFVRSPKDVTELRALIAKHNHPAKVMAKIEKPEAIKLIDKIVEVADAIMIARGDLAVEVPMEKLPIIQKDIIKKCLQASKPVIVATQLMESMIHNPSPTRAEITDVANAVLDGADCLMLSAETSVGRHPVKVVAAMTRIISEAQLTFDFSGSRPLPNPKSATFLSDILCLNTAKTSSELKCKAIIGMTSSGYTAFKVSSFRYNTPIHIFSDLTDTLSMLSIVWGVQCHYYDKFVSTDETIEDVVDILKEKNILKKGDLAVNIGSMPLYKRYRANMMKITIVE